jgi:hypothetical protein
MSQKDTLDKVKSKEGILSKIQNIFGMGYATKEDLRELDKKLRDIYYQDLKTLRHRWEEIYLAALNVGLKTSGDDFKKVIQVMDRFTAKINRADYGYAGLFDRKGAIREGELTNTFDYDKAFSADISFFSASVDELYKLYEEERWPDVPAKVKKIRSLILNLESKWDDREKQFRSSEV